MITIILALIVGATMGIGGLFGGAWALEQWHRRKRVSLLDQMKAQELLHERAVDGYSDILGGEWQYKHGYQWCLDSLFDVGYRERICREAEEKYPAKGAKA